MSVYRVQPPCIISFSGGRTSGFMLRKILDAHRGKLPEGVHAVFCNTSKEAPETLNFVSQCAEQWAVRIHWLEHDWDAPHRFREVSHNTASRDGEVFRKLIARKGFLPTPVMRYCTGHMKRDCIQAFARHSLGWKAWFAAVGIRADETSRLKPCQNNRPTGERVLYPVAAAGHDRHAVMAFWRKQPFDLPFESWRSNCDLCFLKSPKILKRTIRAAPEAAQFWIDMEAFASDPKNGFKRQRFNREVSYAQLREEALTEPELPLSPWEADIGMPQCQNCTD